MRAAFLATAIAFAGLVDDSKGTKMTRADRQTPSPGGDPPSQLAEGSAGQPGQLESLLAPPTPRAEFMDLPRDVHRKLVGDFLTGNAGDSLGLQHASKAMRSEENCLKPLELDPRRVQETIEAGDWQTGWSTVPENAKSDRGVVIAAIEAGLIESFAEIFTPAGEEDGLMGPGGPLGAGDEREVDEDAVVAAIRKGLLTDPATQLGQQYVLSAKETAALIQQGSWSGRFEDIPAAFREEGPTLSPEVLAAALRRDDIVVSPEQIPRHLLDTSAEVLAATIHKWWGPERSSWADIPGRFRSGATASGAVVGAAIAKGLRGAPACLDEVRRLSPHLHHHDDITIAGLRRGPAWFPAWEDLPEAAKGSVRVITEILDEDSTAHYIVQDLARRIRKGEVEGAHAGWGSLVRMPARTDVRILRKALFHFPELFRRSWDADVPSTARSDLKCMLLAVAESGKEDSLVSRGLVGKNVAHPAPGRLLATVSHALHVPAAVVRSEKFVSAAIGTNLLRQWADVPLALRGSFTVVWAVVWNVRNRGSLRWWWQQSVHEKMRQEEVAAGGADLSFSHFSNLFDVDDFHFFRDVQEPAASDARLIRQAIFAFGRETLEAWAARANPLRLRASFSVPREAYLASSSSAVLRDYNVLNWLRSNVAAKLGNNVELRENPEDERTIQENRAIHALPDYLR